MSTHTHRGTCPACGRQQAVKNTSSLLAKHGYTTKWGFFANVCPGSNQLPLELSRTYTDEVAVPRLREYAAACAETTVEDIKLVPVTVYHRGAKSETKWINEEQFRAHSAELSAARPLYYGASVDEEWAQRCANQLHKVKADVADALLHVTFLLDLADRTVGKPLTPVAVDTTERLSELFRNDREGLTRLSQRAIELRAAGWTVKTRREQGNWYTRLTATRGA